MFGFKKKNIMLGCMTALMAVCVNSNSVSAEYNYNEYPYASVSGERSIRLNDYAKGDLSQSTQRIIGNKTVLSPTNRILEIQRKVAQANGLVVEKRQGGFDFKYKITPAILVKDYYNATMTSAGDLLLGTEHLKKMGYDVYTYNNNNFIAESSLLAMIAHETGHSVLNHNFSVNGEVGRVAVEEGDADLFAVRTGEKLSEYGWYTGLLSRTDDSNENVFPVVSNYIKNNSRGKLIVNPAKQKVDMVSDVFRLEVNGEYIPSNKIGVAFVTNLGYYYTSRYHQMYDFALGQLGYIYGKEGKLNLNNFHTEPNTENEYGKTRLVYRSPNMPNGYKTIAYFRTDIEKLKYDVEHAKETLDAVNNGNPSVEAMDFALYALLKFTMENLF